MQHFLKIPRIAEAFGFMVNAHRGQFYGELPYFTHPLQVAEIVSNMKTPYNDEIIAALLHDVVEDTDVVMPDIRSFCSTNVANVVELLTKDNSLSYEENIDRIIASGNNSAARIKWADNFVNMSGDKSAMSAEKRNKLNKRIYKIIQIAI